MADKRDAGCPMGIRQTVQLFAFVFMVALAGAMLAGCSQHTVAERSGSRSASAQAALSQGSWSQEFPEQAAPRRRASVAHHRRVAAVSRAQVAARPEAATDGAVGIASFYKYEAKTASGEQFKPSELTAAHRTLPFGTRLRVTNVATGQSVTVRVNDRGPFVPGRVVDVSHSAAQALGMVDRGITKVKLEVEK
jgi:rare lipoprotein A